MKKALGVLLLGLGLLPLSACSSDDKDSSSGDPVALCKQAAQTICSKIFSCYSKDELSASAAEVGNNESDCVTKYTDVDHLNCSTEGVKCDSGEKYDADKAKECVSQYDSLSCNEFKGNSATPAACDQVCK